MRVPLSVVAVTMAALFVGVSPLRAAAPQELSTSPSSPETTEPPSGGDTQQAQAPAPPDDTGADEDLTLTLAEPDFTIVTLPTTLRLPRHKSAFRLTHRFTRPLGEGDFSDLLANLFSFDSGSVVGLEFRYALMRATQVGIHRTNDRTIEFFGQRGIVGQAPGGFVSVDGMVTVEGLNNFSRDYTTAVGAVISHLFGERGALYVEPIFVANSNVFLGSGSNDDNTMLIGMGGRIRLGRGTYLLGEWSPRAAGFRPGESLKTFAIEKRSGGHSFQLNFSNGFGTTMGQVARGGANNDDWYIGFNLTRKFWR